MHRFAFFSALFVLLLQFFSAKACSGVEIVSKSAWQARNPIKWYSLPSQISHIIIAHTVTPECQNIGSCSYWMRSMQNYHMDKLAFPDIGYNFVIGGDGRVYEGAGWTTQGTHTRGFNAISLGIAFIGDFRNIAPNQSMLMAARKLIVCGIQQGFVSMNRETHGARDATCTISPGDALYNIIKTWPRFKGGPLPGYTC